MCLDLCLVLVVFDLIGVAALIHGFVRLDAAIPPMIAQKFASYPSSSLEWEILMVSAVGDLYHSANIDTYKE